MFSLNPIKGVSNVSNRNTLGTDDDYSANSVFA